MQNRSFDRRAHPAGAVFWDWRAPDGWLHRRLDWPQPEGIRARGTLLFAGGRGDFIEKYLEAMAHWHARGWSVSAFDWRGQGASRRDAEGQSESLDVLVDDLAAIVDELAGRKQRPLALVGHSMGGHILLRALAEQRVRTDAAVLVAPMLMVNSAPLPPWAAASTAAMVAAFGWGREPIWRTQKSPFGSQRQTFLTSSRARYEDELWWLEKQPGFNLGAPSWGWLDAAFRSCAKLIDERLREVDVPVLLLGTETDRLISAAAIRRAASVLPNAELSMFESAGHEILREADPVRLDALAAIDAFLDRAAPA